MALKFYLCVYPPSNYLELIPKETIDHIYQLTDIVEIIGDFVDLKKSGQNYKALSPFVDEKSPSFVVSPSKQIFKDFSSGKGGDAIKFLMELEGLSYIEAIKYLAQKYGVEIQEKERTPEELQAATEKESLFIVLNYAKEFFQRNLMESDEGKSIAYSYFKERGFNEETIKLFGLGYSPNSWDAFTKEALSKQYSPDLLDKAGLIVRKDTKTYDRFRGRVIFPIFNLSGKSIGFGARILTNDKNQPKYLNSPETAVYHKSNILYGLSHSKHEMRNLDNCYLVEGYTDVISLFQAGVKNVVSSSGTSLTTGQIKLIARYTKNITVLYDGDAAGIRASFRGIDMILEEGMNVHTVLFPTGEDPDSYCRKLGGEKFKNYLKESSKDFISFKTEQSLVDIKNDPLKKSEVIRDIVHSISKIPDLIKRDVFIKQTSRLLDIGHDILNTELNKIRLTEAKGKADKERISQRTETKPQRFEKKQNYTSAPPPPPPPPGNYGGPEERTSSPPSNYIPPPSDSFYSDDDDDFVVQFDTVPIEGVVEDRKVDEPITIENKTLKVLQDMEAQMFRILLLYGNVIVDDENNCVADYILEEIEDIEVTHPVVYHCIDLYQAYKKENDTYPENTYFVRIDDDDIRTLVIDLLTEKYERSENWEKNFIFVEDEKTDLTETVYKTVLRLKWRYVRYVMSSLDSEIKNATVDGLEEVLKKYTALKQTEKAIAKELGITIAGV